MGLWKKFTSWLTGRDEKESDVYANYDKVDEVVTSIKNVKTNQVVDAQDAIREALNKLNNVNGVAQYVGSVDTGAFDGIFDSIGSSIVLSQYLGAKKSEGELNSIAKASTVMMTVASIFLATLSEKVTTSCSSVFSNK